MEPLLRSAPWLSDALALSPVWGLLFGLFALCWVVQLRFWLGPLRHMAVYKTQAEPTESANPEPVSVIVCCRNNLAGIQRLLPLLKFQAYSNFELIIVDDRSDDDTYDWLLAQSHLPNPGFRLVRVSNRPDHISGKKYALTLGIKAAKYEVLLLTDSDCQPSSDKWLRRMAAQVTESNHDAVLGYSPYQAEAGTLNLLIRYDTFYTGLQYLGFAKARKPYMGIGRNLAYRKSIFFATKGFANHASHTGGDDDLFINQAIHEGVVSSVGLCLHPEANIISDPKTTFAAWFKQKWRHLAAGSKYHWKDKLSLGLLQGSHVGFYFLALLLVWVFPLNLAVLALYLLRLLVVWIVQYRAMKRLNEAFPPFTLPLLDAWMPVHYLVFGLPALVRPKVAWA